MPSWAVRRLSNFLHGQNVYRDIAYTSCLFWLPTAVTVEWMSVSTHMYGYIGVAWGCAHIHVCLCFKEESEVTDSCKCSWEHRLSYLSLLNCLWVKVSNKFVCVYIVH